MKTYIWKYLLSFTVVCLIGWFAVAVKNTDFIADCNCFACIFAQHFLHYT